MADRSSLMSFFGLKLGRRSGAPASDPRWSWSAHSRATQIDLKVDNDESVQRPVAVDSGPGRISLHPISIAPSSTQGHSSLEDLERLSSIDLMFAVDDTWESDTGHSSRPALPSSSFSGGVSQRTSSRRSMPITRTVSPESQTGAETVPEMPKYSSTSSIAAIGGASPKGIPGTPDTGGSDSVIEERSNLMFAPDNAASSEQLSTASLSMHNETPMITLTRPNSTSPDAYESFPRPPRGVLINPLREHPTHESISFGPETVSEIFLPLERDSHFPARADSFLALAMPSLLKPLPPIPDAERPSCKLERPRSSMRPDGSRFSTGSYFDTSFSGSLPSEIAFSAPRGSDRFSSASFEGIGNKLSRRREFFFVTSICMTQFCIQAGLGQTLSIIHNIAASYNVTNTGDLAWLVAGYSLTVGTFILFGGRLGDSFGHKRVFILGFSWSAFWAAIAGFAFWSNSVLLILCRVFHGIGAAMSLPNGMALLGAQYPPGKKKGIIFAVFSAMTPLGLVIGSTGSALIALDWWPISYWIFSAVLIIITITAYFSIPISIQGLDKTSAPSNFRTAVMDLDIPGMMTFIASLILIAFAFNEGAIAGWSQAYIWMALIVGVLFVFLFMLLEFHYSPNPLIPFHTFTPRVWVILSSLACGWSCFGIWIYYVWQYLQASHGLSALLVNAWLSPMVIVGMLAAFTTGLLLYKLGPAKVLTTSMLAFMIATILLANAAGSGDTPYWGSIFVATLIVPFGLDMSFPAATLLLSSAVDIRHQGLATGLVATVMNYGIALGIGIGATAEIQVRGGTTSQDPQKILNGFQAALYTGVGLSALGTLICLSYLWTKHHESRKNEPRGMCISCHGRLSERESERVDLNAGHVGFEENMEKGGF